MESEDGRDGIVSAEIEEGELVQLGVGIRSQEGRWHIGQLRQPECKKYVPNCSSEAVTKLWSLVAIKCSKDLDGIFSTRLLLDVI